MVRSHALGDLEKVFLTPTIKIIDEEATRIPVVLSSVEDFELDEGGLASLHRRVVLTFRTVLLFWHMLDVRQILNVHALLGAKHGGEPGAPVFFGRDPRQLNIVLEADHVLLSFLHNAALPLLSFNSFGLAGLQLYGELLLLLQLFLVQIGLVVLKLNKLFLLPQAARSI